LVDGTSRAAASSGTLAVGGGDYPLNRTILGRAVVFTVDQ
jgi:hypothetical protein